MTAGLLMTAPAWASLFSSCGADFGPKPDWVNRPDYSVPGHYVGIGSANKGGKSVEEQRKASENDARSNLVQQIEVTIRAENEQSKQVKNNKDVQEYAATKVVVTAEEVLRDLKIKDRWVDNNTCTAYTLVIISKESVAQAKREKLMRSRFEKMKALLAAGTDSEKNRDLKLRRQYLDDAKLLFDEIEFNLLNEEYSKAAYARKIADALSGIDNELAKTQGHMAAFALNRDGKIQPALLGKMLDQLHAGNSKIDHLTADCSSDNDCIGKARERGFDTLILLNVEARIENSNMGALKGTLSISKTVYDIPSKNVVTGPIAASAQIIGWSNDELNWDSAADKAMQGLK